jgi:hypothetical protein
MILEKAYEYKVDIHQLYIEYKQAYDTINRAELVEIMEEFGIPMKFVRLVKMNTNSKVKIQGKLSPSFETAITATRRFVIHHFIQLMYGKDNRKC